MDRLITYEFASRTSSPILSRTGTAVLRDIEELSDTKLKFTGVAFDDVGSENIELVRGCALLTKVARR
jgi:hypothetical protein